VLIDALCRKARLAQTLENAHRPTGSSLCGLITRAKSGLCGGSAQASESKTCFLKEQIKSDAWSLFSGKSAYWWCAWVLSIWVLQRNDFRIYNGMAVLTWSFFFDAADCLCYWNIALVIKSKNQHIISTYANGYWGDSAVGVESDPASAPRLGITYLATMLNLKATKTKHHHASNHCWFMVKDTKGKTVEKLLRISSNWWIISEIQCLFFSDATDLFVSYTSFAIADIAHKPQHN